MGVQPLITISMNNYCTTKGEKVCEEGGVRTLANEDYSLNVAQICITVLNEDMSNVLICNGKNRRIDGEFEGW